MGKDLHGRKGRAEIEKRVGALNPIGHHGPREDDSLLEARRAYKGGGLDHRVGAMRDDDELFRSAFAGFGDARAIDILHVDAVDELVHFDLDRHLDADEFENFRQGAFLKSKLPPNFVVELVEGSTGDDDANRFGGHELSMVALWAFGKLQSV